MRGEGGVAGSQPISTAVHIMWHWAQINFGDLPPYLIYSMTRMENNPLPLPWHCANPICVADSSSCTRYPLVKYGVRSRKVYWAPVYCSCTHWLSLRPRNSPTFPQHLGSYTRALLVSQDRRHLFVTPCVCIPLPSTALTRELVF